MQKLKFDAICECKIQVSPAIPYTLPFPLMPTTVITLDPKREELTLEWE